MRRVVVTGLGTINPLGNNVNASWNSLIESNSGISKITGEELKLTFHCWWKWEGDKIVQTQCYFETADLLKEAALYAETQNAKTQ